MTDEERMRRGEEARRILNEPLLIEAFDAIERSAVNELVSVPLENDALRRCLTERIRVIRDLKSNLETTIALGDQVKKAPPSIY
jgi:hypothetical protein